MYYGMNYADHSLQRIKYCEAKNSECLPLNLDTSIKYHSRDKSLMLEFFRFSHLRSLICLVSDKYMYQMKEIFQLTAYVRMSALLYSLPHNKTFGFYIFYVFRLFQMEVKITQKYAMPCQFLWTKHMHSIISYNIYLQQLFMKQDEKQQKALFLHCVKVFIGTFLTTGLQPSFERPIIICCLCVCVSVCLSLCPLFSYVLHTHPMYFFIYVNISLSG